MELYTVYQKRNYDYRGSDIFTIQCSRDEIAQIVEELNHKNDKINGKNCGMMGSSDYYDYRFTGMFFQSKEEYINFIHERKIREMEQLADKRAYYVDNWRM